ncbi:MAG: permease-like cell division protein FtsX [Thermodesulfobacteriota bacterium]|nr:permease-like cell division protein FtsX [Thermodesulfobacteriota bacterium]
MFLRKGFYFFNKAFQGIRQSLFINFINFGTITVSLLVFGTFLIILFNLNRFLDEWTCENHVTIYLDDTLSSDNVFDIKDRIARFEEVERVTYISKREALNIVKEALQIYDNSFEGLGVNPLPATLEIQLKKKFLSSNDVESFVARMRTFKEFKEIQYDKEWVRDFSAFFCLFWIGSLSIGIGLLSATILIVSNSFQLGVYARKEELEIMKLVGATDVFIKIPFFLEGIFQGLLGAFVSIGLLYCIYQAVIFKVKPFLSIYIRELDLSFLPLSFIFGVIIGGSLMGMLGSFVSMRKITKNY